MTDYMLHVGAVLASTIADGADVLFVTATDEPNGTKGIWTGVSTWNGRYTDKSGPTLLLVILGGSRKRRDGPRPRLVRLRLGGPYGSIQGTGRTIFHVLEERMIRLRLRRGHLDGDGEWKMGSGRKRAVESVQAFIRPLIRRLTAVEVSRSRSLFPFTETN